MTMESTRRALMALATLALMIGAVRILAFQQPAPGQPELIARGELLSVDTVAKHLSIRTTEKIDMQFRYTEQTEVTGAKEGSAGLATVTGAQVTVHFTREGPVNVATKIEVRSVLRLAQ
jgi:hypothetical protein